MKSLPYAVLILAAGSSSRMGRPKQLLPWGDGTLLQHAITNATTSSFDTVAVVLGANSEAIQKTLQPNVIYVVNSDWQKGMGSSIACGMQFLLASKHKFAAVLIMLGDQPLIDSEYLITMRSTFQADEKNIVATNYQGRAGVPAMFSSTYFDQLKQLNAEFGAKELLTKHFSDIELLDAGNKTRDIDTEADYLKLNQTSK